MDMKKLRAELSLDEGRRHVPYKDQFGNWTCGVGHEMGRQPFKGEYWSDKKIDATLDADVASTVLRLEGESWWSKLDTDARQRALVNMAFNLGVHGVSAFKTFLKYINNQEWSKAGADLKNTAWYSEVPARAERIIRLLS